MTRLFFHTLLEFMSDLLIFKGNLSVFFPLGISIISLDERTFSKQVQFEEYVLGNLAGQPDMEETSLTLDVPLFIYSPSKELIYSNRGLGRRRNPQAMASGLNVVEKKGSVIGYYHAGSQHFFKRQGQGKVSEVHESDRLYSSCLFLSNCALLRPPFYRQPHHHPAATSYFD